MIKFHKNSEEEKQKLEDLGLKEYQGRKLPVVLNPTSYSYWFVHGSILLGCAAYRIYLRKYTNAPHGLATTMGLITIYSMYKDQFRYDYQHLLTPWRPTQLEDYLETSPITRNAYEKALIENQNFQRKLKQKINELKEEIEE